MNNDVVAADVEPETLSARTAIERLRKLAAARISATSPRKRATVTYADGSYEVELRPQGFQQLDPGVLAEEVVHAFAGVLRGCEHADKTIMGAHRPTEPSTQPDPRRQHRREQLRRARNAIAVTAASPNGLVRGNWSGGDGVRLRITAVNESHREQLATEIATVLNKLSELYRMELKRIMRETKRRVPSEEES
ncbi:MAG: hypothetical protein ACRD0P_09020 [Stackebrandtia sp.]